MTGGYVGVDVFFVISGFLITSHLLKQPPVTRRGLAQFWARRIRRLLPAATITLLITLVASWWWLPETQLTTAAKEGRAAALYFENWQLAWTAADYLAADSAPSPIQHYWSLSVEEQFYLFWPLLIAGLALLGRWWGRSRRARDLAVYAGGIGVVFAASLTYSWWYTAADPAKAYFVTPTRVWELALGALTALAGSVLARRAGSLRAAVAWVGLALVGYSAFFYDAKTAFPGLAALVPTGGTALVILARSDSVRWSPRMLLGNRVAVFLGDVSYSLYLWHWPVVILGPYVLGHDPGRWDKVGFFALSVVLAYLSKRFVEDPMRYWSGIRLHTVRTYAVGASLMALVVLLAAGQISAVQDRKQQERRIAAEMEASAKGCFGAAAVDGEGCTLSGKELFTKPLMAATDSAAVYGKDCLVDKPFSARTRCTLGVEDAPRKIALLGNSHAASWSPTFDAVADAEGWRLDTYLAFACFPTERPLDYPGESGQGCLDWSNWARQEIEKGGYDAVVISTQTIRDFQGVPRNKRYEVAKTSYANIIKGFTQAGLDVLVMRDTPWYPDPVPDCVATQPGDAWRTGCDYPLDKVQGSDALADAAQRFGGDKVTVLDANAILCPQDSCRAVLGGVITMRDEHHLSSTFARSLAPVLHDQIVRALS